jgi:formylglycine-generating enzyme required for sulfatase activity
MPAQSGSFSLSDRDNRSSNGRDVAGNLSDAWVNPRDNSVMRLIPAGEFVMGSTPEQIEAARLMDIYGSQFTLLDELPQFRAFLPDFYLSECAVTNEQFAKFLNATSPPAEQFKLWIPSLEKIILPTNKIEIYRVTSGFEKHPVVHVSWFGAEAYCRWAGLRLPTELEWEKAARGADGRIFPWGNEWRDEFLRWHNTACNGATTAPVDAYPQGRSPFGIFQMAGNVDEWCAEPYQWDVYRRYAAGDLRPPPNGGMRVVRGGMCVGWQKIRFRCAHRRGNDAAIVNIHYTGIRCACDTKQALKTAGLNP